MYHPPYASDRLTELGTCLYLLVARYSTLKDNPNFPTFPSLHNSASQLNNAEVCSDNSSNLSTRLPSLRKDFGSVSSQLVPQIDARASTFNDVKGDQHNNYHVVINNNSNTHEDQAKPEDEPDDPSIDTELNKYPPIVAYGLKIVTRTTTLITTNIAAAIANLEIPSPSDLVTDTLQSIKVIKTSFRHSFFSEPRDPCSPVCTSCLRPYS